MSLPCNSLDRKKMLLFALCVVNNCIVKTQAQEIIQPMTTNETIFVRLQGGDTPIEGRVEIFYNNEWGTVCDDEWNIKAASIICKMLGYDGALEFIHSGKFGPGEGTIWLDNVHCNGAESDISECTFRGWGDHDCSHHEDAGVKCSPRRLPGVFFDQHGKDGFHFIRLRSPKGQRRQVPQRHGFVEVYYNEKWSKICSKSWKKETASIICGELGFPAAEKIKKKDVYLSKAKRRHHFGVSDLACLGTESKLNQCEFHMIDATKSRNCENGEPLILRCVPGYMNIVGKMRKHKKTKKWRKRHHIKTSKSIRLKAGASEGEGRLEVKRNGQWGTVCHRGFTLLSANAACRQLGYGTAKREIHNSFFGQGHGPIWLTDVRCHGNETALSECLHENISQANSHHEDSSSGECTHSEDVSVSCNVPQLNMQHRIRLVGGRNPMEGRVEVKIRKKWGPVCSDNWSSKDAMVVCRQLGLGFALHALKAVYYFPGSDNATNLVMTGIQCNGDEKALQFCKHDGKILSNCGDPARSLTPFAGVICTELSPDLIQDIPLLQQSIHLDDQPLHNLYCAAEEKCLSQSADDMKWPYGSRRLLRFSTRVWNRGRADFRPAKTQDQWIWHQCHGHYHSMSEFTHYDLVDLNFTEVAEGHKASFCLEDTQCDPDVSPRFDCDQPGGGVQGIAVGCSDNYQYNIDCQWMDITDVPKGNYLIRIRVNPHALVAESDFSNNEVYCNLQYDAHRVWAWNCHIRDDYDPKVIQRYYTAEVYP